MLVSTWVSYVITVLVLMSIPGPSQLLMLSVSMRYGSSKAIATAVGDLSANSLQMLAASLGLAAVLAASVIALSIVKWLGVMCLIYMGIKMIFLRPESKERLVGRNSVAISRLYWQGFITSAANPKAVIFFSALFPQFIDLSRSLTLQFLILSVTYIVLDSLFLSVYAYCAQYISRFIASKNKKIMDYIGGSAMLVAAFLLARKSIARVN